MAQGARLSFTLLGLSGLIFIVAFAMREFYHSTCTAPFGWASFGLFMTGVALLVSANLGEAIRQHAEKGGDLRQKAMVMLAVLGVSAAIVAFILLAGTRLPSFDPCLRL